MCKREVKNLRHTNTGVGTPTRSGDCIIVLLSVYI